MFEIASQIFICLLIAALIGMIIGYFIGKMNCKDKEDSHIIQKDSSCSGDSSVKNDKEEIETKEETNKSVDNKIQDDKEEQESSLETKLISQEETKEEESKAKDESEDKTDEQTSLDENQEENIVKEDESKNEEEATENTNTSKDKPKEESNNQTQEEKPKDIDAPKGLEAPRDGKKDDLKQIKGVGVKIEEKLNSLGIFHYDQIANWTKKEIDWVNSFLHFSGRIEREKWVEQAKVLAKGEMTEFAKRVAEGKVPSSKKD